MMNGSGRRKLQSWIESFIELTADLHSPAIFRRWAAISAIGATLEQKVWVTSRALYPNIYAVLVAPPGVGKTRTINECRRYIAELPEFHLAPVSMTFAALVDCLVKAKRIIIRHGGEDPLEYNSMYICADELGAFMHKYDDEMINGLSAFYDATPYQHNRRTSDLRIKIISPQVSLLAGSTPANLIGFMPEKAWAQGFTSRLVMVFSDERIIGDDFVETTDPYSEDLAHDLLMINSICGQYQVTDEYQTLVNFWKQDKTEIPIPSHPKLTHYVTRRPAHLYKLSMISAADRSADLILTKDDFNRAMNWLVEAETFMPDVFKAGASNADGQAIDEIAHYIMISDRGNGVSETQITRFARDRVPIHSILRIVELMERSGQIKLFGTDKRTQIKYYKATT